MRAGSAVITFKRLRELFRISRVNPAGALMPAGLSFLAALSEGTGMLLLILIARGLGRMDYRLVERNPFVSSVVSKLTSDPDKRTLLIFLGLITALLMFITLKNILFYLSSIAAVRFTGKFGQGLTSSIFNRYMDFGKLFFDRVNAGRLHATLNAVNPLARQLETLNKHIAVLFMFLIYLIVLSRISWPLTLAVIFIIPVVNSLIKKRFKSTHISATRQSFDDISLTERAFNVFSCIPLVKSYNQEEREKKDFWENTERLRQKACNSEKITRLLPFLHDIIFNVVLLGIMVMIGVMVIKGRTARVAEMLAFFYILRRSASGFGVLGSIRDLVAKMGGHVKIINNTFQGRIRSEVTSGSKTFEGLKEAIRCSELSFSYGSGERVLRKLTLTIKKSKMTAIVGRSGSGKTTLINILMRMYECPPGKVFFDGVDIRDYTTASIRDGIAYVSQEPLLFNDTLRKNLIYGMEDKVSDEDINKAIAKAKLLQFLKSLPAGLETIVGDRGTRLSGGERQRVAIARAILKNAGILILDEATSSVDLHTEMLLQSDIEELTRGRTTIVIAHRLSTIKKADWIIVLNGGRVVEEGDMETLLAKKGVFHKHWTEQKFTNDESFQTISVA